MSPCSLVGCQHQGGGRKAEDFDLAAVFWLYCLSKPWLWQLPVPPGAAGLCCSALGTLSHRLLFLFLPCCGSPKHSALSWLCARGPAAWRTPAVSLRSLWMICCNIILDLLFGKSWFSIQLLHFGAFPCPVVQNLFVFWGFFPHSDSEKCFKNKTQWKLV